jgi:hypothetical protein
LRIGKSLAQPADRLHLTFIKLVFARLNVDGDELVSVGVGKVRANLALGEGVPTTGEFFFAVAALGGGHA